MIGEKINGLLILSLDEVKNNKLKKERREGLRTNAPVYYLCRCDCGNIISLTKPKILKRKIQGCNKCNQINFNQYIGKKINNWYIMNYLGNYKFKCKCDCGNIEDVNCYNILHGLSKNWGCIRKEKMSKYASINSLVGDRYGNLTVIKEKGKNKYGKTICECLCDCGNKIDVLSNSLRTGHTYSCGCVKSKTPSQIKIYLENLGYNVEMEKHIALNDRGISCLSFDLYVEELNLAIEYDGKPHFIPIDWAGKGIEWAIENLQLAEFRDEEKNKYCCDNGIFLLRIPFTRKDNYEILINEIIEIITNND